MEAGCFDAFVTGGLGGCLVDLVQGLVMDGVWLDGCMYIDNGCKQDMYIDNGCKQEWGWLD